jgi:hypothetical protein
VSFRWRGSVWIKAPLGATDKPYNAIFIDPITRRTEDRGFVSDETLVYETEGLPPLVYNVIKLADWVQERAGKGA